MLGNVCEWCHDGWRTYKAGALVDPVGPTDASGRRVIRGGSWSFSAQDMRAAYRGWAHLNHCYDFLGFRCASSGRR
jgi:formylglycine-generating enzyme required for sulfatase activity